MYISEKFCFHHLFFENHDKKYKKNSGYWLASRAAICHTNTNAVGPGPIGALPQT
jgi:hypothetical protein